MMMIARVYTGCICTCMLCNTAPFDPHTRDTGSPTAMHAMFPTFLLFLVDSAIPCRGVAGFVVTLLCIGGTQE